MTTKDYIKLAAALAEARPRYDSDDKSDSEVMMNQWLLLRHTIMKRLQLDNPNFNHKKFLAATEAN